MKKYRNHIEENHNVFLGKPVLKGTRIGVEIVLSELSQGQVLRILKVCILMSLKTKLVLV